MLNIWKVHKLLLATFTTLTIVSLSISQPEENTNDVAELWGSTDIEISLLKYTWTVNNLKLCCQKVGDIIASPKFLDNNGCNWYFNVYPKGQAEDYKNYLGIYLFADNCTTTATVNLSILTSKGEKAEIQTFTHKYSPSTKSWGFGEFVLQSSLLDPEKNLLPNNNLTILCEITATRGTEDSSGNSSQPNKRRLMEDLEFLLENEVFSDVILTAGGKEFKVHKAILAARSPVFKTMFEKDTEKQKIELTDVDPKTLSEMLRYIYTEETPNLKNLAPDLLAAAENYDLDELKTMCENSLHENLSIENAVDYFILGDKYRALNLKMEAQHFIIAHASVITNTTGFKSLITTKPLLALETFKLLG